MLITVGSFHVVLFCIKFYTTQGAADKSFFSLCDLSDIPKGWQRNTGYELKAWIKSITPVAVKELDTQQQQQQPLEAYFDAKDEFLMTYDVPSITEFAWRAFGLKHLDGWLYGRVDAKNNFLVNQTLYIYPDFRTALLGSFSSVDDVLIEGTETKITHYRCNNGTMELKYDLPKEGSIAYKSHKPMLNYLSPTPLIRDPFERQSVYLGPSQAFPEMGEEDSLFAKRNIPKYDLIAYYNGYLADYYDYPTNYSSMYSFEKYNVEFNSTTQMNLPENYSNSSNYIATLAHKANHHFSKYNARIDEVKHPVYGEILCLKAIQHIKSGQEILINYAYDTSEKTLPSWYKDLYLKHYNVSELPLSDEEKIN